MPEKINSSKMASSSKCSCCPYGFHIDRDFVRFCDTLYNAAQLDKLRQHKRERRKEKKSVESYLGIGNIIIPLKEKANIDVTNKIATLPHDFYLHSDGLKDAVNDFEDTWKRSLKKSSSSNDIAEKPNGFYSLRKKPSVLSNFHSFSGDKKDILCSSDASKSRSSSTSSVSSQSTTISNFNGLVTSDASNFVLTPDHITATVTGLSKPFTVKSGSGIQKSVLTNIREQMASSLLRLKDLEEQVKCIPILQVKLSALKEEKKSLLNQLKFNQNSIEKETHSTKQNNLEIQLKRLENQGIMSPTLTRKCLSTVQSESNLSSPGMASCLDAAISKKCFIEKEIISQIKLNEQKGKDSPKVLKSIGTSCSVLTRDIGIGYVPSKFKSIAVGCDTLPSDSLYSYKSNKSFDKYVNLSSESLESDLESFGGSDEQCKQSLHINKTSKSPVTKSIHYKNFVNSSTSMDIIHLHKSTNTDIVPFVHNSVERAFMKSSSSKSVQTSELKTFKNKCLQTLLDSSKSESSKYKFKRDVAIGEFDINETICSGCKKIKKSIAVGNFDVKISDCEKCRMQSNSSNKYNISLSKTKTVGVGDLDINYDVCKNCEQVKCANLVNITKTNSIGINTINESLSFTNLTTNSDIHICDKCSATIHSVARGLAANTNDSKIPRSNVKSSPPSKSNNAAKLPKLKIPVYKSPKNDDRNDKSSNNTQIKKDYKKEESIISLQLENQNITMKETKLSVKTQEERKDKSESYHELPSLMNLTATPRKKLEISKEIKAACKVLNDCLQKSDKGSEKKALSSLGIIQNEWFRVANQKNADPLLIEDYLDFFEEFSKLLLQRVVNLSDNNGNTALHYAVSYGNFDVVSILIDSKVCDVNKKNKAGYTSIMLVALAEMKNDAHQYVVQRLFSIGDINMKATQNGQTALMLAVSHGKKDIAKILIDAGAEVNLQDKDGSTALMCAAEHRHLEIVKNLLSHPECDPTIVDNDDCNALTIAMEAGHKDIGLLIYTNMNFSRGSSPYSTLKSRKRSTPPPRTPTLRTPPLPSPSARSTNSIPASFHFST